MKPLECGFGLTFKWQWKFGRDMSVSDHARKIFFGPFWLWFFW